MTRWAPLLAVASAFALLVYLPLFHYTGQHEVGLKFNPFMGTVQADTPGFNFSAPWVAVAKLDTRPQRVCVTTVAKVLVCKLVRFNPEGYSEFVKREGFRYYWLDNRISFNFGYAEEYRGVRDLLRGYAFEGTPQKFLEFPPG
jgi:hypothetical protein